MDGRLLLLAGLVAVVFAAGVGQSVVATTDAPFSQVVDEAVEGDGAEPARPAAESTDGDGTSATGGSGEASATGGNAGAATAGAAGDDGASEVDASAGPSVRFRIGSIDRCGRTCRDVTATLVNRQDRAASDLVVETAIYAGNDTNDGDRVWRGTERVGALAADAEHTSTRRVTLGWGGGLAVKRAGGWITVQTSVETAEGSVTLERRREVA